MHKVVYQVFIRTQEKTVHPWLDLEAQVARGDEDENDPWEIGKE